MSEAELKGLIEQLREAIAQLTKRVEALENKTRNERFGPTKGSRG
jgi:prefoldin subunit 5